MVSAASSLRAWSDEAGTPKRRAKPITDALARVAQNKLALAGSIVAIIYILIGIFGPFFAPHDYAVQNLMSTFKRPFTPGHLLGTDQLGRDMLSRLVVGIRISLLVGFGVTAISLVVGTFAGTIAGYYRGWVDTVFSILIELT
jgi:peptide/nickel transport system permease protein